MKMALYDTIAAFMVWARPSVTS